MQWCSPLLRILLAIVAVSLLAAAVFAGRAVWNRWRGQAADPTLSWTSIGDMKFGTSLVHAVTYGNGKFVAVGEGGKGSYSTDGVTWNAIGNMQFGTSTANAVTYGNGKFVAVGEGGKGSYSTDGVTWNAIGDMEFTYVIESVTYGNGIFVAVGGGGDISYSPDGITWTAVTGAPKPTLWYSIAYGNGKFVVVGSAGNAAYSTDGIAWTGIGDMIGRTPDSLTAVAFGGGRFVVGGTSGTNMQYSTDGITWTGGGHFASANNLYTVTYGESMFLAFSEDGIVGRSTDGSTWSRNDDIVRSLGLDRGLYPRGSAYGDGKFVVVGHIHPTTSFGPSFGNGVIAQIAANTASSTASSPLCGNGREDYPEECGEPLMTPCYLMGVNLTCRNCRCEWAQQSESDPLWIDVGPPHANGSTCTQECAKRGKTCRESGCALFQATDGKEWSGGERRETGTGPIPFHALCSTSWGTLSPSVLNDCCCGPDLTSSSISSTASSIIVSSSRSSSASSSRSSSVHSSSVSSAAALSPLTWTAVSVQDATVVFRAVAYGNGRFVAVGKERKGVYSDNGTAWTPVTTPYPFETIAFGNGRFVAGSYDGTAAYSVDGITWTAITGMDRMGNIMFVNGRFFAARNGGAAASSADGITWSPLQVPVPLEDGVVYGNGKYVTVGSTNAGGIIKNGATSVDGISWTAFNNRTFFDPSMPNATYFGTSSSIMFANGRFIAISRGGQRIYSTDGVTWTFDRNVVGVSSLIFAGDRYFAVSTNGTGHYSGDGEGWTGTDVRIRARSIAYGNGRHVAVGESGYVSYSGPPVPESSHSSAYSSSRASSSVSPPASSAGGGATAPFTWVPIPQMPSFTTMAYGNGTYVGAIYGESSGWVSRDGVMWTAVPRLLGPVEKNVTAVAFGNGVFVAGGYDSRISYSTDGVTWTSVNMPPNQQVDLMVIESIAFGNGKFVALGGGSAAVSTDGRTWQQASGAPFGGLNDALAYGNGKWVRVGAFGHGAVSQDGRTWNAIADMKLGQLADLKSVAFGNGAFVAVGQRGWGTVSTDGGATWTKIPDTTFGQNDIIRSVAFGNGYFVAVGAANKGAYSADGMTWTVIPDMALDRWSGAQHLIFDGQRFIAVSQGKGSYAGPAFYPASSASSSSSAGIAWDQLSIVPGNAIAFGNGMFVKGTNRGAGAYSTDGVTWTPVGDMQFNMLEIKSITYGNGTFVAVGGNARAAYSTDGIHWNRMQNGDNGTALRSVAYGNNRFVAIGGPLNRYSTNGISWSGWGDLKFLSSDVYSVAFGNGKFVAVGGGLTSYAPYTKGSYSTDGQNWTVIGNMGFTPNHSTVHSIAYGKNSFVAVGSYGQVSTSIDGVTWLLRRIDPSPGDLTLVRYCGDRIVAATRNQLLTSSDGLVTWTVLSDTPFISDVACGNGKVIAVQNNTDTSSPASSQQFEPSSAASQLSSPAAVGICGNFVREAGEGCEVGVACPDGTGCNVETCMCEQETRLQRAQSLCGNGRLDPGEDCESGMPLLYEPCKEGHSCNVQTCRCPGGKSRFLRGRTKP